jgi:trimeric autotransporter adhesin
MEQIVLGSVAKTAEPNREYKFLDEKPQMGINFYRLRLPESNDTYSYTDVVALNYELTATDPYFIVYPNPANDVLSVTLKQVTQNAVVSIYSLSGVLLKTYSIKNSNREVFNVSDLEPGLYVIKITDVEKNEFGTEKFIKN